MNLGGPAVRIEETVVPLSDAGAQPRTVMVMHRDASVTNATMKHSRRLYYVAGWTLFALDFVLVLLLVGLLAYLH